MNIFGLGPLEILLILVIALIVFGPAKLPEIMGQVGRAIADFRRATGQLSDEFNRTIQAELQETRGVFDETRSAVTGVQSSINSAISGTAAAVSIPAPTLSAPAPAPVTAPQTNGVTAPNGTNGTHAAPPSTPALADTTQWSWETSAPAPSTPAIVAPPSTDVQNAPLARRRTRTNDLLPPY